MTSKIMKNVQLIHLRKELMCANPVDCFKMYQYDFMVRLDVEKPNDKSKRVYRQLIAEN